MYQAGSLHPERIDLVRFRDTP